MIMTTSRQTFRYSIAGLSYYLAKLDKYHRKNLEFELYEWPESKQKIRKWRARLSGNYTHYLFLQNISTRNLQDFCNLWLESTTFYKLTDYQHTIENRKGNGEVKFFPYVCRCYMRKDTKMENSAIIIMATIFSWIL